VVEVLSAESESPLAKAPALRQAGYDEENITRATIDDAAADGGYRSAKALNNFEKRKDFDNRKIVVRPPF